MGSTATFILVLFTNWNTVEGFQTLKSTFLNTAFLTSLYASVLFPDSGWNVPFIHFVLFSVFGQLCFISHGSRNLL